MNGLFKSSADNITEEVVNYPHQSPFSFNNRYFVSKIFPPEDIGSAKYEILNSLIKGGRLPEHSVIALGHGEGAPGKFTVAGQPLHDLLNDIKNVALAVNKNEKPALAIYSCNPRGGLCYEDLSRLVKDIKKETGKEPRLFYTPPFTIAPSIGLIPEFNTKGRPATPLDAVRAANLYANIYLNRKGLDDYFNRKYNKFKDEVVNNLMQGKFAGNLEKVKSLLKLYLTTALYKAQTSHYGFDPLKPSTVVDFKNDPQIKQLFLINEMAAGLWNKKLKDIDIPLKESPEYYGFKTKGELLDALLAAKERRFKDKTRTNYVKEVLDKSIDLGKTLRFVNYDKIHPTRLTHYLAHIDSQYVTPSPYVTQPVFDTYKEYLKELGPFGGSMKTYLHYINEYLKPKRREPADFTDDVRLGLAEDIATRLDHLYIPAIMQYDELRRSGLKPEEALDKLDPDSRDLIKTLLDKGLIYASRQPEKTYATG